MRAPSLVFCAFLTVFGGAYIIYGTALARAAGIVVILFGVVEVAATFRERLTISYDVVVLRGLVRTRRLSRDKVKSARLAHQGTVFWRVVIVDDHDHSYKLGGVGAFGLRRSAADRSAAGRAVALINERIGPAEVG